MTDNAEQRASGPAEIDVLIVGAGPTGLTLACELARTGIDCLVIERAETVNSASKAKTIQPRSLEVLDDLGAVDRVVARGVVDLPMRFHGPDGAVTDKPGIAVRAGDPEGTPYPDPLWIGQFDVEAALRERYADLGGRVRLATTAISLDQDDRGVTVEAATPEGPVTFRSRYVVGADGGKSTVRKLIGLPLVGETYGSQRWYLGDVVADGLDRDHMHIWPSDRGMLGLTPLPGSDLWQFQSPVPADVREPAEPSLELYQSMLDERAGSESVRLSDASWLSVYAVNVRMVETYRNGRVLLAGDAAHVHSPAGGQGMNTGIQDACNLGWKLSAVLRGAKDDLLDTYTEERAPVARAVLDDSTVKMGRTLTTTSGTAGQLSTALGSLSDDVTSGLLVSYRDSRLTLPAAEGDRTRLPAGSRAPDASGLRGRDAAGQPFSGTVFDLLRGTHWTLLAFDHAEELLLDRAKPDHMHIHRIGSHAGAELRDEEGHAHRNYEPRPGELVLIRPDGYIAARIPASEEMRMIAHLGAFRPEGERV